MPCNSRTYITCDSDSDENLYRMHDAPYQSRSPYGSDSRLCDNSNVNRRRHSSYSHEDILNLKFQQPTIDPRYRDSRPFVSSASNIYSYNARRDFFSRRRSSSSLHDDIIQPFQPLQKFIRPDGILRKSNTTLNSSTNLSEKSNSKWDLNPSIFIEEYSDDKEVEVKSNCSSTNVSCAEAHEPLNEETVAPFLAFEEIPFIDDENDNSTDHSEIYVPQMALNSHYADHCKEGGGSAAKKPLVIRNRKTVSFDLMESKDGSTDDELAACTKHAVMNKSNTWDQHINNIKHSSNAGTKQPNETIFKYCTYNRPSKADGSGNLSFKKPLQLEQENFDKIFAHFDDDEYDEPSHHNNNNKKTTVTQLPNTSITSVTNNTKELPMKMAKPVAWVPTNLYDKLSYGNGKVQALRSYFESMSEPTPNDFLTDEEQSSTIDQLREWSSFGTKSDRFKQKCSHSVFNLSDIGGSRCQFCANKQKCSNLDRCMSVPNMNNYHLKPDMIIPELKMDRPYAKYRNCRTHGNDKFFTRNSSELNPKRYYDDAHNYIPCSSPYHRSRFLTLRKIKHDQNQKKVRSASGSTVELNGSESDGGMEPR